jgi:hypothetical protein
LYSFLISPVRATCQLNPSSLIWSPQRMFRCGEYLT